MKKPWEEPQETDRWSFIEFVYSSNKDTLLWMYKKEAGQSDSENSLIKSVEIWLGENEGNGRDNWCEFHFDEKGVKLEVMTCSYDELGAIDEAEETKYFKG